MYRLAKKIFPIYRSITGEGVRETLRILAEECPFLKIHEMLSGTKVFDWEVPKEWEIREAYIENEQGEKVIDFRQNHLHIVGYSQPLDVWVTREELQTYVYTQPDQPDVIPYVTSYYEKRSGFCMSQQMMRALPEGNYHLYIDSAFYDGSMTWGEIVLPGQTEEEICFSTNICHPGMGNNEVSGPCVLTFLAKRLMQQDRRYTCRFLFLPETIGSIAYISRHLAQMQKNIRAGFVVTCVGDDRQYSYVSSRTGDTLADRALIQILKENCPDYVSYSYLQRGSDERQYCAPGVNLPFCVFCRSKFHEYKEYHTSADDLSFISQEGMEHSLQILLKIVQLLEYNRYYKTTILCEPQLGRRGLYPTIGQNSQGRTIYELACMGIPSIVLAQNNRELGHVFAGISNGFINLGIGREQENEAICATVEWLIRTPNVRRQMHELLLEKDFRQGQERVIRLILGGGQEHDF